MQVEIKHAEERDDTHRLQQPTYLHPQADPARSPRRGRPDLGADDRVEPALDAAVSNGMTARLVRVAGRRFNERETVERQTVLKPDEDLQATGTRRSGQRRRAVREYKIVIEDGVEREKTFVQQYYRARSQSTT